ncbi:MAG: hypothetical protein H6819_07360 [Phycisphaerales bacterium]|nr:hypothetical protein [Phycisphaerales bacterium]MCB9857688.1 hypothetical protein [Phycisphaerales bacterium]MCB9864777.1 hypothetical protein [Phycisphaerales bacterium]
MREVFSTRTARAVRNMGVAAIAVAGLGWNANAIAGPWASQVVAYEPGLNPEAGYSSDPSVALGAPERTTGENTPFGSFPADVTMFSSPYGLDEVVSIGEGGYLTLQLDTPALDDANHLYGADLIVFGNTFFNTDDFVVGDISGITPDPANIEVSSDNVTWFPVSPKADGLFPTQGYLDSGIFGTDAFGAPNGTIASDYLKPMNPALSTADFLGLTYIDALALYDGSAGGTAIDIAESGLSSVSYIRFSVPMGAGYNAEIDAVTIVPEPVTAALFCMIGPAACIRRRNA